MEIQSYEYQIYVIVNLKIRVFIEMLIEYYSLAWNYGI